MIAIAKRDSAVYLDHYGLAEPPFRITPHTEFFYRGANRGATLEALQYAILHGEGLVKVTGEVGAGKTMLCRVLMEGLPADIDTVYLANPSMSKEEILLAIAEDLKLDLPGARSSVLIRALQDALIERYAAGRQVVVLIDEAHAMPEESLEEVRLLSNLEHGHHKLLQIVLFGQPELDEKLAPQAMRQLRERITHSFELAPLRQADVGEYLIFRLRTAGYKGPDPFTRHAVRRIAAESEGLTRRINILADKSLIASFAADRHQVNDTDARAACRDSAFRGRRLRRHAWPLAGAGLLALGILLGTLGGHWLTPPASGLAKAPSGLASPVRTSANTHQPVVTPSAPTAKTPAALPGTESTPTDLLSRRLSQSQAMLDSEADGRYTVQFSITPRQARQELAKMLASTARQLSAEQLYVYPLTSRQGVPYMALSYGLFMDRAAALQAQAGLPANLQRNQPILRTVGSIKQELRENAEQIAKRASPGPQGDG
ncbi:AAA family ATPase [Chitinimonas arctica]|uniref:AAA family ATPase n=1 Tax=Chitinimonas arctica TaxID=2594795 RepID=A0A516SEQ5_9NEIS|nr:AAA family ATPase [Chitinimonas arctica]QDQ26508.1 AAA family ATPase [Chitinimonas arctica]